MATEGLIMMEDNISCGSAPGSASGSPRNRIKFLCSHGGKILPRLAVGHLKYVGGETRVISVPRDIKFPELMKKLTYLIEDEMVLKYQLVLEDLDALISVKNDKDLRHMFNEHDQYESAPRLRAFLFPAKPIVVENDVETHAAEQRYIDAINGIVRISLSGMMHNPSFIVYPGVSFGISSACSSPRSPESWNTDGNDQEAAFQNNYYSSRTHMQRVQSTPTVCNLTGLQQSGACGHQLCPQNYYYQASRQPFNRGHQYPSKPPIDSHKSAGPERLISVRYFGRAEGVRYEVDHVPVYYQSTPRYFRSSGCFFKCMHDEYGPGFDSRMDRVNSSLSPSPTLSPRHGHVFVNKAWDIAVGTEN